ncbi:MAG: PAS domain-containing sensor histidine kinase [Candidatus Peregrinibacteria bacterium]
MAKARSKSRPSLPHLIIPISKGIGSEKKLNQEYHSYFEQLFRNYPEAIARVGDKGRIEDVNLAFTELFGYIPSEVKGKIIDDLIVPPYLAHEANSFTRQGLHGHKLRTETIRQHKDGREVHVALKTFPIVVGGQQIGAFAIYRDITDRKRAEEALAKSEERYALASHATNDGLWDWDIVKDEKYYSPRFKELLEFKDWEITNKELQKKLPIFLAPGEWKRMQAAQKAHFNHGTPYNIEYAVILASGERRWFCSRAQAIWDEKTGKPLRMTGSIRDITRRKLAEAELANSKKLLHDILQGSPISTYVIDNNHKIIIWNKAMERLTGRSAKEVIGTDRHWEAFYPKKRPMVVDYMIDGLPTASILRQHYSNTKFRKSQFENGVIGDVFFPNFYGGGKWLKFMIKPLYDLKGNRIGAIEMAEDIHQQTLDHERVLHFNEELQVKIAEKTRHLEEANKHLRSLNELKDEFIAVTSHELRSPLTAARGYLSFLNDPELLNSLPSTARQYFSRAYNNVETLNHLVNNILDVSRIEGGRFTLNKVQADLVGLTKGIIDNLLITAREKRLKVRFRNLTGSHKLLMPLDTVRIHQVMVNLLDNAIKYSTEGKTITIYLKKKASWAEVHVQDQGIGIPQKEIPKIFEKFMQAKNAAVRYKGGAGLGLFIAQRIIELHGGKIEVKSILRKGTTFILHLPL